MSGKRKPVKRASSGPSAQEQMDSQPVRNGKKKSVSDCLTQNQEHELAEWFSEHVFFYDQSHRSFKDKEMKNQLLDDKGKQYGVSGHELWQWLQSMRTMFGKLYKKKSGQARCQVTARQQWIMENFSFLTAHLLPKTKTRELGQLPAANQPTGSSSRPVSPSPSDAPVTKTSDNEEDRAAGVSAASALVDLSRSGGGAAGQGSRKRKNPQNEEVLAFIAERMKASERMEKRLDEALRGGNDHKQAFGHWMMTEMVQLPDALWTQFRTEAFQLLTSFQDRARAGMAHQHQQNPQPQHQPYFQAQPLYHMNVSYQQQHHSVGQWPSAGHPPPPMHPPPQQRPQQPETTPRQQQQGQTAGTTPPMHGQGGRLNISGLSDLVDTWPTGSASLSTPCNEPVLTTLRPVHEASTPESSGFAHPASDSDDIDV